MNFIVVTQEWMSARGLMPLPTMRKNKDGTKIILHEDYFNAFRREDEETGTTAYAHNSPELNALLTSGEWAESEEQTDTQSPDYIQVAAVRNLMTATKANIQSYTLTDKEVNRVADLLPDWSELIGKQLATGFKLRYEGKPYRVAQAHTPQSDWKPSEVNSLYNLISNHTGSHADPIPYEHWMLLETGKYYTEFGILYKCKKSPGAGYDSDLSGLAQFVEVVEE